jgi:glycosyltransferase involved in cell wall biosynthesis
MAGKIRIALLTSTIDGRRASGTALVARKCVEALLARQTEFDITLLHYELADDPIYQAGAREVLMPRLPWPLNRRSLRFLAYVLSTRDRFDIIHWFQPRLYPYFFLAPARHTVVTVHGAGDITDNKAHFIFSRFFYNLTLILLRRKIRIAIAGSTYAANDIIEKYGFLREQVRAVNNGVDPAFARATPEEIERCREKYGLPRGKFFLGVGRMVPNKNVPRIIEAYNLFCRTNSGNEIPLIHVGTRGSDRERVEELIAAGAYRERIRLQGFIEQEDLPALYSAAFALVFPLLNEGFGLPALEAMACGTPAIVSDTAFPEITEDDAVLVNALSEKSIAEGMRKIVNDETLYRTLKEDGQKKAKMYTWERMTENVIKIYKDLAQT